ncbi:hypothetical protein LSTR_LSTR007201 [Laodelphax striatellus]|uniref:SAM-dependent MTase RsmB/NOP-type domain-containing protein n=1 Tax=Laodelphax striatellus TaxID=195883 RepID=A0A482WRC8_LAOST|nr:hypothetical protein LSTR_LSTR007201 [Laodelphax striatellus]
MSKYKPSKNSARAPALFQEAAIILKKLSHGGSFNSLIFKNWLRDPQGLTALVTKASQYRSLIDRVIDSLRLLDLEPNLDIWLVRILIAHLCFGGKQRISGASPVVKAVLKYRNEIQEAVVREDKYGLRALHRVQVGKPRYVRVNTLKTTTEEFIKILKDEGFGELTCPDTYDKFLQLVEDTMIEKKSDEIFMRDFHVKDMLVFPRDTFFQHHPAYREGKIVLQDKASCLQSCCVKPPPGSVVLDMCSAPGMKTSLYAAMIQNTGKIYAIERSEFRFHDMQNILETLGATCVTTINNDAGVIGPETCANVEYIVVDPSCSGSGMSGRDKLEDLELQFQPQHRQTPSPDQRIQKLQNLQTYLLKHALSNFPQARCIVYSTCSKEALENEAVVEKCLNCARLNGFGVVDLSVRLKGWRHFGHPGFRCGPRTVYTKEADLMNGGCGPKTVYTEETDAMKFFVVFEKEEEERVKQSVERFVGKSVEVKRLAALESSDSNCRGVNRVLVFPESSGSAPANSSLSPEDLHQRFAANQFTLLRHAFTAFSQAKRIVYATSSTHPAENEEIIDALQVVAKFHGFNQVDAVARVGGNWRNNRQTLYHCGEKCLMMQEKCGKGLFVAVFERDDHVEGLDSDQVSKFTDGIEEFPSRLNQSKDVPMSVPNDNSSQVSNFTEVAVFERDDHVEGLDSDQVSKFTDGIEGFPSRLNQSEDVPMSVPEDDANQVSNVTDVTKKIDSQLEFSNALKSLKCLGPKVLDISGHNVFLNQSEDVPMSVPDDNSNQVSNFTDVSKEIPSQLEFSKALKSVGSKVLDKSGHNVFLNQTEDVPMSVPDDVSNQVSNLTDVAEKIASQLEFSNALKSLKCVGSKVLGKSGQSEDVPMSVPDEDSNQVSNSTDVAEEISSQLEFSNALKSLKCVGSKVLDKSANNVSAIGELFFIDTDGNTCADEGSPNEIVEVKSCDSSITEKRRMRRQRQREERKKWRKLERQRKERELIALNKKENTEAAGTSSINPASSNVGDATKDIADGADVIVEKQRKKNKWTRERKRLAKEAREAKAAKKAQQAKAAKKMQPPSSPSKVSNCQTDMVSLGGQKMFPCLYQMTIPIKSQMSQMLPKSFPANWSFQMH